MNTIKIGVYKQLDGYNFSITPSIREFVRKLFPNAFPANNIFVGYDTKSDFESNVDKIEPFIYPALLGLPKGADIGKIDTIEFVDSETGKVMYKVNPGDDEEV